MLTNESPPADVAAAIIAETKRRGYSRDESIACVSTGVQESGLRMVWDSGKRWFGYFQQDGSYPNRFDPMGNILGFLDRLDQKRRSPGASPDPFKNIFWLQQRPSDPSADTAYDRGRRAYYDEIRRHIGVATAYYDRFAGAPAPPPPAAPQAYGMPRGSNSGGYGGNGVRFPDWVYALGNAFGLKPSTYPGHQETNRNEAGYAPNPQLLNRGIDWAAPGASDEIDRITRFADYLATIPQHLEQAIWRNPHTKRSIEIAGRRHQPGYFGESELRRHENHGHTRQSKPIPLPGGAPTPPPPPARPAVVVQRIGDPVWLPDVLRAEGLTVNEVPGWRDRGHGDFGEIRGIVVHHTGSNNASPESIAFHPSLGLASQLHLARDGVWTICGVGIAWHAGNGGGITWLPNNDANRFTIGIEAANDGGGTPGKPHRSSWPAEQYDSYVRGCAAILRKIGQG